MGRGNGLTCRYGIARQLSDSAARFPERVLVVDGGRRWTYAEFASTVQKCAAALVQLGLQRAARVAIYLDNSIEHMAAVYGAAATGLIAVPINAKLKARQVTYVLRDCGASVLITTNHRLSDLKAYEALEDLCCVLVGRSAEPCATSTGAVKWEEWLAEADVSGPFHDFLESDAALILYTSGSTGSPKGVVVSHRNLVVGAESVNAYFGTRPDDVLLALLPLSFDAGLSQVTTAVAAGARAVLCTYLRAQEVAELCDSEQITILVGVPPLWSQLVGASWGRRGASLRLFGNTGGHMSRRLLGQLTTLFPNATPYLMYGLTEAFRSTYLDPGQIAARPDSVGKAMPNVEIMLLRPDGTPCAPGEEGELVHLGPLVSLGYWNDPVRTAERFRSVPNRLSPGLLPAFGVWSGDLFTRDAAGYLYFVGRRDEMIKSSGYRISPTEIEKVLHAAPGVLEAIVFGIQDESLGQVPVAAVVPAVSPLAVQDVLSHCCRALPSYMVPRLVEVRDLPRLSNGKIDRASAKAVCSAYRASSLGT